MGRDEERGGLREAALPDTPLRRRGWTPGADLGMRPLGGEERVAREE
jgi:hypothetical protein